MVVSTSTRRGRIDQPTSRAIDIHLQLSCWCRSWKTSGLIEVIGEAIDAGTSKKSKMLTLTPSAIEGSVKTWELSALRFGAGEMLARRALAQADLTLYKSWSSGNSRPRLSTVKSQAPESQSSLHLLRNTVIKLVLMFLLQQTWRWPCQCWSPSKMVAIAFQGVKSVL